MIEIDGPWMGHFETLGERREFRTFALRSKNFDILAQTLDHTLNHIKAHLRGKPDGMLVWRKRPHIEWDEEDDVFTAYFRMWTNYEIPDLFC